MIQPGSNETNRNLAPEVVAVIVALLAAAGDDDAQAPLAAWRVAGLPQPNWGVRGARDWRESARDYGRSRGW